MKRLWQWFDGLVFLFRQRPDKGAYTGYKLGRDPQAGAGHTP